MEKKSHFFDEGWQKIAALNQATSMEDTHRKAAIFPSPAVFSRAFLR
jgi:hypothetical protein